MSYFQFTSFYNAHEAHSAEKFKKASPYALYVHVTFCINDPVTLSNLFWVDYAAWECTGMSTTFVVRHFAFVDGRQQLSSSSCHKNTNLHVI